MGRARQPLRPSLRAQPKGRVTGRTTILPKRQPSLLGMRTPRRSHPLSWAMAQGRGWWLLLVPSLRDPAARCPLTHKDYAIEEVESFIKPSDIEPCAQLRTEDLGASALFDLTRVSLLSWLTSPYLFLVHWLTTVSFSGLHACQGTSGPVCGQGGCRHPS